jgi:hypothetical protein
MLNYKILILSIFILTNISILPSDPAKLSTSSPKHKKTVSFVDKKQDILSTALQDTQSQTSLSKRTIVHYNDDDEIYPESKKTELKETSLFDSQCDYSLQSYLNNSNTNPEQTKSKTMPSSSSSSSENEIISIRQKVKLGGVITLSTLAAAGSIQLKQYLEKDNNPPIRRSLLEAGDIFGAGRTAEGAGSIIKGIALAIAAGGAIYTVRKYFGLIDARFEAQEEKHKTMTELRLRRNNEEWQTRVEKAFEAQQKITRDYNEDWARRLLLRTDQERDGMFKIIRPLISSVEDINNAIQQEKERNHKRIEPLVDGLAYITEILQGQKCSSVSTSEKLQVLQQNAEKAAMLNNASDSSMSTATGINANLQKATDALNSQSLKPLTLIESPAQAPTIKVDQPKVQEKQSCSCCCVQ